MESIRDYNLYYCFYNKQMERYAVIREFSTCDELERYYKKLENLIKVKQGKMIFSFVFNNEGRELKYLVANEGSEMLVKEEWGISLSCFTDNPNEAVSFEPKRIKNTVLLVGAYVKIRKILSGGKMKLSSIKVTGNLKTSLSLVSLTDQISKKD